MLIGQVSLFRDIYSYLSNNQPEVLLSFFIGFFLISAIAIRFNRNKHIREGYIVLFICLLLFVNISTISLFPFMHWYKFSEPRTAETTSHLIKVVDSDGRELLLDARATPPLIGSSYYALGYQMDEVYSPEKRHEVGGYLLGNACQYRERLQRGSLPLTKLIEFPRHTLDYQWSAQHLNGYSEFTAIHVYDVRMQTSEDGRRITLYEETLTQAIDPGNCSTVTGMTE